MARKGKGFARTGTARRGIAMQWLHAAQIDIEIWRSAVRKQTGLGRAGQCEALHGFAGPGMAGHGMARHGRAMQWLHESLIALGQRDEGCWSKVFCLATGFRTCTGLFAAGLCCAGHGNALQGKARASRTRNGPRREVYCWYEGINDDFAMRCKEMLGSERCGRAWLGFAGQGTARHGMEWLCYARL